MYDNIVFAEVFLVFTINLVKKNFINTNLTWEFTVDIDH